MRQRLSAKKLVVATYLQCILAGDAGDYMGPERRTLSRRRGRPRQIPQDPASAMRDLERVGLDRRLLYVRQLRAPDLALDCRHGDYPCARGAIDSALLGWPRRGHSRRGVLAPGAEAQRERFGAEGHG